MFRIAIVDDDEKYRNEIVKYIKRYEQESGNKFTVAMFCDGDEIAEDYKAQYDIILMDIEMKFMDGMAAAEKIRSLDSEVIIMFITNSPQYAMKGYMVDALDYVLKPISYYAFSQKIARALTKINRHSTVFISVSIKGGFKKINVSELTYIEVRDHDLAYHTVGENYVTKGTLAEAEKELGGMHFFRCNKCYLINLEYVEAMKDSEVKIGNDWIQVSRARKKALMDALNDYMNEVGK